MTTNYHAAIETGETNAPSTINSRLASLDAAISAQGGAGGTFTLANGAAAAAQKIVTVDSTSGLVAGASVVYTLVGGVIETNTIATVDSATQVTLTTNIGTGGIADNGVLAQITPDMASGRGNYDTITARLNGTDALPGAARVGANVSAAATAITTRTALNTLGANLGWVAVDPFTAQCEIRKIASISGTTVNLHLALGYDHGVDDAMLWMPTPEISVEMFGAVGDGATDDAAAIQAALNAADNLKSSASHTGRGATVMMGPSVFLINSSITIPGSVTLRGAGSASSSIVAGASFSGTTVSLPVGGTGDVMIFIGAAGGAEVYGTCLEYVFVDANHYADICVYSDAINENSGIRYVRLQDALEHALYIATSNAQNYTIEALEVQMNGGSASASAVGIYVNGGNSSGGRWYNITSNSDSGAIDANIQLENVNGMLLSHLHTETGTDGILIGAVAACEGIAIIGLQASGSANAVHIASAGGSNNITLIGVSRGGLGGETNLILDDIQGATITATHHAMYVAGRADFRNTTTAPYTFEQSSNAGAKAVIQLTQKDTDQAFLNLVGTSINGSLIRSLVEEADVSTATRAGFAKIYVQDDGNQLTDQAYFFPIYTLA